MPSEKISVFFHGYFHAQENLQDNSIKLENISRTFKKCRDQRLLFDESAETWPETAAKIKAMIEDIGFAAFYIAGDINTRTGKMPDRDDVVRKVRELANVPDSEIIASGSVHPRIVSRYLLGRGLDKLRDDVPFDFDMEYHNPAIVQNNVYLLNRSEANKAKAVDYWKNGAKKGAVMEYKEALRLRSAVRKARDDDTKGRLKDVIGRWSRMNTDGSLFLNYGVAHITLSDDLRRDFRDEAVEFNEYIAPNLLLSAQLYRGMRNKAQIFDRDYLNRFLHEGVLDEITYQRRVWNPRLLWGYVDFSVLVSNFWQSLEPQEIDQAVGPKSLIDFMLKHPQGQAIEAYL